MTTEARDATAPWPLVGVGVLVMDDEDRREIDRKGRVVFHDVESGRILVQWVSWMDGNPSYATFHRMADLGGLNGWLFFESVGEMYAWIARLKK